MENSRIAASASMGEMRDERISGTGEMLSGKGAAAHG
jgi:hypothetical protein